MKIRSAINAAVMTAILTGICFANAIIVGPMSDDRTVDQGAKYEGLILLKNTDSKPQSVKIWQTEYLFYADGTTNYGNPGTNPRSNLKWITLPGNKVIVPPNSDSSVTFTVKVPSNKKLKGSYWSIIMVTPLDEDLDAAPKPEEKGLKIKTIFQYGYQVSTSIGETGAVKIKFLEKSVATREGSTFLSVGIQNTGERLIIPDVWANLFDSKGTNLGKFEGKKMRIYPGCSVSDEIDITRAPQGQYKALVIVDSKTGNPFGAQYDLYKK